MVQLGGTADGAYHCPLGSIMAIFDIVTVANVDDEDCIGNSLLQIWELRIVHKAKLLFRL